MKKSSRSNPLSLPDDSSLTTEAVQALRAMGLCFHRPTPHQLKIGSVNYYPNTGSIQRDGQSKEPAKGLNALKSILESIHGPLKEIELLQHSSLFLDVDAK